MANIELEVQKYLRAGKTLENLKEEFGISANQHGGYKKLYSLKYDQIDSHSVRSHPIVRECRGLILDSTLNRYISI